jgi:hypothetical protein
MNQDASVGEEVVERVADAFVAVPVVGGVGQQHPEAKVEVLELIKVVFTRNTNFFVVRHEFGWKIQKSVGRPLFLASDRIFCCPTEFFFVSSNIFFQKSSFVLTDL